MDEKQVIRKYKLDLDYSDSATIVSVMMKNHAEILHIDEQHGNICFWALCPEFAGEVVRRFRVVGIGDPWEKKLTEKYIGTVLLKGGVYVFHVFELHSE